MGYGENALHIENLKEHQSSIIIDKIKLNLVGQSLRFLYVYILGRPFKWHEKFYCN